MATTSASTAPGSRTSSPGRRRLRTCAAAPASDAMVRRCQRRGGSVVRYVVGRVLQMVLTLLVVLTLLWVAISVLPGDPVRALFGFRQPSPEAYARVQEQLRLDRPLLEQYLLYLRDVL